MDAIRCTGAGLTPVAGDDCPTSTNRDALTAEQIYHNYAPRVYNMARRMVRSDADAEDVTQDVLLQVVRKLPTFRGESALPTWLHRVTLNTAISHRRKRAVREEHLERMMEEGRRMNQKCLVPPSSFSLPPSEAPEARLLGRETRNLIERAIANLPPLYRTVFVLADVEGLPNAVIADRLGLSLPAIKSRLHRARQLMRDALTPHFQDLSALLS